MLILGRDQWITMKTTLKHLRLKILLLTIRERPRAGFWRTLVQSEDKFRNSLLASFHSRGYKMCAIYLTFFPCGLSRKKEKDRAVHCLHINTEQKLLEVIFN
ncbi:hypothetical protein RND81_07G028900 [Saponaria officinalis]|uniref:Uncharacterized protein n=1 Tax=Saponaria officinalis TaxID=3572 RepID=A0AAW1JKB1_SAPOF